MISVERYQELLEIAEEAKRKRDQATGAYSSYLKRLKDEFGCSTLKEAEFLLAKKQIEIAKKSKLLESKLAEFEKAFSDELE